ncbi:MAG: sigma-70 family RNA polymerase sigma factor [Polyangiaceae bacterium]|nr:sigma-70 family RNA polymerase sigma factor [Polyangiaceae bacterium]
MAQGDVPKAERDRADAAAIERIRNGDTAAVAVLYEHYGRTAFGLALKIVREEGEAEDVVHDAFVAIVHRVDQYHPARGTVAAWLVTTVRNLALDRARRRVRRANIVESELKHEPMPEVASPEEGLTNVREHDRIRRAMAKLPQAQRETLEIAFFEGLSYPEIAERERVPLGTIKSRAARALHALRDALEADQD